MFETSTTTEKLDDALAKVQGRGDRFVEAVLIRQLCKTQKNVARRPEYIRFITKVAFGISDCWYWIGAQHTLGYGFFAGTKAHRASWRLAHGQSVPKGLSVLHKCDVRSCVNPDHLFLGTQLANVRDMMSKGRAKFGKPRFNESNPMTKFSDALVARLREEARTTNLSQNALARKYGISPMQASRIILNLARKPNGKV